MLKYIPATMEVVAEFSLKHVPGAIFQCNLSAQDIISKAEARLQKAKEDEGAKYFCVNTAKIAQVMDSLAQLPETPNPGQKSTGKVVVGKCFRDDFDMQQIQFAEGGSQVSFTLATLGKSSIPFLAEALYTKVHKSYQMAGFGDCPFAMAQFHQVAKAWEQTNFKTTSFKLNSFANLGSSTQPYRFFPWEQNREVFLRIDRNPMGPLPEMIERLTNDAIRHVRLLQQKAQKKYIFHKKHLEESVKKLSESLALANIDLPCYIAIAMVSDPVVTSTQAPSQAEEQKKPLDYPGKGILQIEVSSDAMAAKIYDWKHEYYSDFAEKLDDQWLACELARSRIPSSPSKNFLIADLTTMLRRHEDLNGALAAEGVRPIPGKKPYLEITPYLHEKIESTDAINPRDSQFLNLYPPGVQCAELKFHEHPIIGRNVFGEIIEPEAEHTFIAESGIEERKKGLFFSTRWGVPVLSKTGIKLDEVYRHKGDVNLTTGNIYFDGPVHISGSVDAGATVFSKGDLLVEGSIGQATIICLRNLKVNSGVVMGDRGSLFVQGDAEIGFMENANFTVAGNLKVSRSILNSNGVVGGRIRVNPESGVISGGIIHCRQGITAKNIGMQRGQVTEVHVGGDWKAENKLSKFQRRSVRLDKASEDSRYRLRELTANKRPPPNAEAQKAKLSQKLTRIRSIQERIKAYITQLRAQYTFFDKPEIRVPGTLYSNVIVKMRGKNLKINMDYSFVGVTCVGNASPMVVPLEQLPPAPQDGQADPSNAA
jgi:hypothetical protein